jgi:ferredoxin
MTTHTVEIVVPEDADISEAGETIELSVDESETILGVARASGLWLPADCQQGWCTTCAARLDDGEVDQSTAKRYYETDEEEGFILTCTAKPRSDLRIIACQHDAILDHRAAHDLPPGNSKAKQ